MSLFIHKPHDIWLYGILAVALALAVVATTIAVQTVNAAPPVPELTQFSFCKI